MKVAIIGTRGLPANYGGFETLAAHLTKYALEGIDYTVFCSAKAYDKKLKTYNGATLEYIGLDANGIQSIPYDLISIIKAVRHHDVLLILGVASGLFLPLLRVLKPSKRLILNVDGLEWKREKWNAFAKWFLRISERVGAKAANKVVADNAIIQQHLKSAYGIHAHLIAYGGDHAKKRSLSSETLAMFPFLKHPYCFKVCRIEPENNIAMILEAFKELPQHQLVIVGNWERSVYGQELKRTYRAFDHMHLIDPIYEQSKLDELRSNAWLYIHGHSAGGTNPSLVEAMCIGLPILAFDVNYNRASTQGEAHYFKTKEDLVKQLTVLDDIMLNSSKERLSKIAQTHYLWTKIADAYTNLMIAE